MEESQVSPTETSPLIDITLNEGNERLLEVYQQIDFVDDPALMLANLLTGMHKFSWSLNESNAINGRQSKNRVTIQSTNRQLMKYFNEENVDDFIDEQTNKLFNYVISTYLLDKYTLSGGNQEIERKRNRAKTLYIMLFTTQSYYAINSVKAPEYLVDSINKVFDYLMDEQDSIYTEFIEYLESHESPEVLEVASSIGQELWGSDTKKATQTFSQYFRDVLTKFYDYDNTYKTWLLFRSRYLGVTSNITASSLCEFFDITYNTVRHQKDAILNEITEIFSENESALAIQRLIFGS